MRGLSWIIWLGCKCHHKCPYKEEAEGNLAAEEKTM